MPTLPLAVTVLVHQLQEQLDAVTARMDDAGASVWKRFSEERPWGYELVHLLAEAVKDELKRLRHEKNLASQSEKLIL